MPVSKTILRTIRQFQSDIEAIRNAPDPISARITIYVLTGLIVGAGLLLALAQVERVVTSRAGKIVPLTANLNFQALDQSIVKSLDVKEGQLVTKGQRLATLDPVFADADVQQLRHQVASLDAQIARAEAEVANKTPQLAATTDADRARYAALQMQLFAQRQAQYAAQINSFDQKIGLAQATLKKLQTDEAHLLDREKIAQQLEGIRGTLQEKGFGTLVNLLATQDQRLELQRNLEFTRNSLKEAHHQHSSLRADREAFVQQWATGISQEIVTARNQRDTAVASLDKALKHQDVVHLTAPIDSFVLSVAKVSVGSVLKPGDMLIILAPLNGEVEAEIQITPRDIGFVRPGDPTTLKVDAFNFAEHGVASGRIKWISEGAFTTDDAGQTLPEGYYKARVSIDTMRFVHVPPTFRLIPGMTLTADVVVGKRSLAVYLMSIMTRSASEAMREP